MCDPVLIAAILRLRSFPRTVIGNPYCHRDGQSPVAIPGLSLEKLDFLNEKKEKDKKEEADDEETNKDKLRNNGGKTKIAYKCQFACLAPEIYLSIVKIRPPTITISIKENCNSIKTSNG